jgi:hypothetical protein
MPVNFDTPQAAALIVGVALVLLLTMGKVFGSVNIRVGS